MNFPLDPHEPTPEFRAHLEWQIETALRRETRLTSPVTGGARRLVTGLLVVAALATGGIAGLASGRVQDARERDRLTDAARSEEALIRVRLDLAQTELQAAQRKFDVGLIGLESLLAAQRQLKALEASLVRTQLDIEEIRATSATPRNDLDAPLVGGRDFVRERLNLDLKDAQQELAMAEQTVAQAIQRVEVGVVPPTVRLQAESDLAKARVRMQQLIATLDLRQRYLKGEVKREALAPAARRTELTLQLESTRREIDLLGARVAEVRSQLEIGRADQLDVKRVEVELLERQLEMTRIQQELKALEAVKR
jgi:outer membrane protein TolC